ncbi:MAG: hypothetical protein H0U32_11340 [Thermoleophilaceae bacterium]|nr:hypothetical protein [Thermoleophilaceae bacterium]
MAYDDPANLPSDSSDRGAAGRRRHRTDSNEKLRSVAAALLALCGALSIVYFAVAAIGAVDLADAALASGIALLLALLWLAGLWQRSRSNAGMATRGDRERRGF